MKVDSCCRVEAAVSTEVAFDFKRGAGAQTIESIVAQLEELSQAFLCQAAVARRLAYCLYSAPMLAQMTTLVLLVAALGATRAAADDAESACLDHPVRLQVFTKGLGKPLARAEVIVDGRTYQTDSEGLVAFCWPALAPVPVAQIQRKGYESLSFKAGRTPSTDPIPVYLTPDFFSDQNVIDVIGRRANAVGVTAISGKEAADAAPVGDPVQVIKTLPGVARIGIRPDVAIRGSPPEDSRYFIDDIEVPFVFHRVGQISVLSDRLLSGLEFFPGGFGAEYGDATGGVVVLRTPDKPAAASLTDARLNLPAGAAAYHEQLIGDSGGVSASLRRSFLDSFLPAMVKDKTGLTLVPYSGDAHIVASYRGVATTSKVTLLGSYDGLKLAFPDAAASEDGFDIYNAFGVLAWELKATPAAGWLLDTTPQGYYLTNRSNIMDHRKDFATRSARLPINVSHRLSSRQRLRFGTEVERQESQFHFERGAQSIGLPWIEAVEPPEQTADVKVLQTASAAWIAMDSAMGALTVTPGLRVQSVTRVQQMAVDPRLAAKIALSERSGASVSVGQYSKAPQPLELSGALRAEALQFERAHHYVLGLEHRWSEAWESSIQTYYKRSFRLVEISRRGMLANGGSARVRGLEIFIRRAASERFFGWLSYTYSRAEDRNDQSQPYRPAAVDQTHIANLVMGGRLTTTWQAATAATYHTGDPFYRVRSAAYRPESDSFVPITTPDDRNARRLPAFFTSDANIMHDILFDTWTMQAKLGLTFLSARPQAYFAKYSYDYAETYYYVGPSTIPYIEMRAVL